MNKVGKDPLSTFSMLHNIIKISKGKLVGFFHETSHTSNLNAIVKNIGTNKLCLV